MPSEVQSIQQSQQEIVDDLSFFDDWMDRYNYIIELGRNAPPLPESLRVEENIVLGCQSQVWLVPTLRDNRVYFQAGSDALISGGLVTLAVRAYSGHTPDEILDADPEFIAKSDMESNLTMQRMNGLRAVIKKMKAYALAYRAIQQRKA